ncbi:MAG: hypothetical protein AAFZ15_17740 [Bacteroidota bacterium]
MSSRKNKTMTIEKGNHYVDLSDRQIAIWHKLKSVKWQYEFEENCRYVLANKNHQLNWNKVGGVSFGSALKNPDQDSAMVGWRYDTEKKEINICPYFNVNGAYVYAKEPSQWLNIQPGTKFTALTEYHDKKCTMTIEVGGQQVTRSVEFSGDFKYSKQIDFYFGGTDPAPQTVTIQVQLLDIDKGHLI